mmetsp:Transcript_509/g.1512  ORF Transcript_509/g.1512 Transcript_509/m.1512 type:complete len:1075 (-) Transcript_509:18-3242(-)
MVAPQPVHSRYSSACRLHSTGRPLRLACERRSINIRGVAFNRRLISLGSRATPHTQSAPQVQATRHAVSKRATAIRLNVGFGVLQRVAAGIAAAAVAALISATSAVAASSLYSELDVDRSDVERLLLEQMRSRMGDMPDDELEAMLLRMVQSESSPDLTDLAPPRKQQGETRRRRAANRTRATQSEASSSRSDARQAPDTASPESSQRQTSAGPAAPTVQLQSEQEPAQEVPPSNRGRSDSGDQGLVTAAEDGGGQGLVERLQRQARDAVQQQLQAAGRAAANSATQLASSVKKQVTNAVMRQFQPDSATQQTAAPEQATAPKRTASSAGMLAAPQLQGEPLKKTDPQHAVAPQQMAEPPVSEAPQPAAKSQETQPPPLPLPSSAESRSEAASASVQQQPPTADPSSGSGLTAAPPKADLSSDRSRAQSDKSRSQSRSQGEGPDSAPRARKGRAPATQPPPPQFDDDDEALAAWESEDFGETQASRRGGTHAAARRKEAAAAAAASATAAAGATSDATGAMLRRAGVALPLPAGTAPLTAGSPDPMPSSVSAMGLFEWTESLADTGELPRVMLGIVAVGVLQWSVQPLIRWRYPDLQLRPGGGDGMNREEDTGSRWDDLGSTFAGSSEGPGSAEGTANGSSLSRLPSWMPRQLPNMPWTTAQAGPASPQIPPVSQPDTGGVIWRRSDPQEETAEDQSGWEYYEDDYPSSYAQWNPALEQATSFGTFPPPLISAAAPAQGVQGGGQGADTTALGAVAPRAAFPLMPSPWDDPGAYRGTSAFSPVAAPSPQQQLSPEQQLPNQQPQLDSQRPQSPKNQSWPPPAMGQGRPVAPNTNAVLPAPVPVVPSRTANGSALSSSSSATDAAQPLYTAPEGASLYTATADAGYQVSAASSTNTGAKSSGGVSNTGGNISNNSRSGSASGSFNGSNTNSVAATDTARSGSHGSSGGTSAGSSIPSAARSAVMTSDLPGDSTSSGARPGRASNAATDNDMRSGGGAGLDGSAGSGSGSGRGRGSHSGSHWQLSVVLRLRTSVVSLTSGIVMSLICIMLISTGQCQCCPTVSTAMADHIQVIGSE